mmetsp:Transcript_9/g.15  ORF Transcript_9/g.15 Transcript_9/m.15 type:complete len:200 (-) Transcript_9:577-1176(-)
MVWPRRSQLGKIISFSTRVLAFRSGHRTMNCLMTSNDSSSLATNTWLAPGEICIAKRLTVSLKVALKSSSWTAGFFLRIPLMRRTLSSANPSALSISSASSNTKIRMPSRARMRLVTQFFSLPCVPTTTCSVMGCLRSPSSAVLVARMLVNLPIRCSTDKFCTTSSRVGQVHNACGSFLLGSTLDNIDSTKQVVLPEPL